MKILVLTNDSMCGIPILSFHNGSGGSGSRSKTSTSNSAVSGSQTLSSKRKAIKRTIDRDHGDNLEDEPPKKRGRPSANHPYQPCGPCSIWLQTGRDARLMQYHTSRAMKHPGKLAESMSAYVSQSGVRVSLQPDSCVCNACDMDYLRNKNSGGLPRWAKLRDDMYNQKHCILCCTTSTNCPCTRVQEWGPSMWHGDKSVQWWGEYFIHKGMHTSINPRAKDMCRLHLREYRRCLANRSCIKCSVTAADTWFPAGGADEFEWVCNICEACSLGRERLESMLQDDLEGENEINKNRAELVELALNKVKSNTFIYTLPLQDKFKKCIGDNNEQKSYLKSFNVCMDKYLSYHGFKSFSGATKLGKLYYDETVHNTKGIEQIYKIVVDKYKLERENQNLKEQESILEIKKVKGLIEEQCKKFPTASNFDYRTLVNSDGSMDEDKFESFFNPELLSLIGKLTKSQKSENKTPSKLYNDMRKLRIFTIISLLCYTKNPSITFIQTIIGLVCYAYGLRDKGFEILNAFGCSCSVDHVRRHGDYWSGQRSMMDELDLKKLWRVSFDNLNFKLRYSKDIKGEGGPKRALNLITGQVAYTQCHDKGSTMANNIPPLKELAKLKLNTFVHPEHISKNNLQENDFQLSEKDYYHNIFNNAVYKCMSNRVSKSTDELDSTLMEDLRGHLPHWTPSNGDKIVYSTVDEGGSASITDVGKYLDKLKGDLHIGESGYPKKILLTGDQQTYKLTKDLQANFPVKYNWFYAVPGDWHLLKLMAELIKSIIWDGGGSRKCVLHVGIKRR